MIKKEERVNVVRIRPAHLFGGATLSPVGGCCVVSAISGLLSDSPAGDGFGDHSFCLG